MVNIIDAVLDPPDTQATTLLNVLSTDHRFTELYRLVSGVPDIIELLRDSHRTLTLMAPTNEAFAALDPVEYSRIQNDHTLSKREWTSSCRRGTFLTNQALVNFNSQFSPELLQLHIVPQSMCSPAIVARHTVRTAGGAKITIGCDGTGVTVNGKESRFLQDYRFANNGFLSAVNKVLIPDPGEYRKFPSEEGTEFPLDICLSRTDESSECSHGKGFMFRNSQNGVGSDVARRPLGFRALCPPLRTGTVSQGLDSYGVCSR